MKILLLKAYLNYISLLMFLIYSFSLIKGSSSQRNITSIKISKRICQNGQFLIAGHFSGSHVNEVVCLFGDGFVRIFNRGIGSVAYHHTVWEGQTPLCKYEKKPKVFVADINGDGFDDILCQRSSGQIEMIFSTMGIFKNLLDWSGKLSKCEKVIAIADVTSDGKNDLICGESEDSPRLKIFSNLL